MGTKFEDSLEPGACWLAGEYLSEEQISVSRAISEKRRADAAVVFAAAHDRMAAAVERDADARQRLIDIIAGGGIERVVGANMKEAAEMFSIAVHHGLRDGLSE